MAHRPRWMQPLIDHPGTPENHHYLNGKRPKFADPNNPNRRQCTAIARSTGKRCERDAVTGVNCCPVHNGLRFLKKRAEACELRGPRKAPALREGRIQRQYYATVAYSCEEVLYEMPLTLRQELAKCTPGARGSKIAGWMNRELNR